MRPLIVKQLDYDLTPVAGLSLAGNLLKLENKINVYPSFALARTLRQNALI